MTSDSVPLNVRLTVCIIFQKKIVEQNYTDACKSVLFARLVAYKKNNWNILDKINMFHCDSACWDRNISVFC